MELSMNLEIMYLNGHKIQSQINFRMFINFTKFVYITYSEELPLFSKISRAVQNVYVFVLISRLYLFQHFYITFKNWEGASSLQTKILMVLENNKVDIISSHSRLVWIYLMYKF